MTNKKGKVLIFVVLGLLVLLLIIFLFANQLNKNKANSEIKSVNVKTFTPEFLSPAEKTERNIPAEATAQVIKRDAQGGVMIYKLVNKESGAIDPATITATSPRAK
jgi:hypothetical protein